jgi:hypothetical protein
MQMGTTAPQTSSELLAFGLDLAKDFNVVPLRKVSLCSV